MAKAKLSIHPQTAPQSTGIAKRLGGSSALGNLIGNLKMLYIDSLVFTGEVPCHLVAEHGSSQILVGTDMRCPG